MAAFVKYEPEKEPRPWSVFMTGIHGRSVYRCGFSTQGEAQAWIEEEDAGEEEKAGESGSNNLSAVDQASKESFPASDPPAWTEATIK